MPIDPSGWRATCLVPRTDLAVSASSRSQRALDSQTNALGEADIGAIRPLAERDDSRPACRSLPEKGRPWAEIRADLITQKRDDYDWRGGRIPIYVYHHNEELLTVCRESYNLFFSENALGQRAFPSLARMEQDIICTSLVLFHAPEGAAGSFTSGGTESIFLALKSARDCFRAAKGRELRPNIVVPRTAHPAFDKAAHYLDISVRRAEVTPELRADVDAIQRAMDAATMLIAGSAPCYPYGVFDPIGALADTASRAGVWFHVDACLGGFLAPFARDEGFPIPEFDFAIEGVASLSADLHKYGFSARGASVVLYRSARLHAFQGFHFEGWPRGTYFTPTFLGSRPGGSIASAWAVLQYLGRAGYRDIARKTMEAKSRLSSGIEKIEGLRVVRPTELSILLYTSTAPEIDISAVAELMVSRGWFVGRSREPRALHLALNPVHEPVIDTYLEDLRWAVEEVRITGKVGHHDDGTY